MAKLFISPHNDDETLFGAYTIMKEKPLVIICTNGYIQGKRGDNITYSERILESCSAMRLLGANVCFLQIPDDELTEENLREKLLQFKTDDVVYIPDIEGGNLQHDLIGKVAGEIFSNHVRYKTYSKDSVRTIGKQVEHNEDMALIKKEALRCYKSQINLPFTKPYFLTDNEEYYAET